MTGGPTAFYCKHGKLQNPFPSHRQTKPVITTHNHGIASFVAEKIFSPKNSDSALRFTPRISNRNWSEGPGLLHRIALERELIGEAEYSRRYFIGDSYALLFPPYRNEHRRLVICVRDAEKPVNAFLL
jgi:hypothetical protein